MATTSTEALAVSHGGREQPLRDRDSATGPKVYSVLCGAALLYAACITVLLLSGDDNLGTDHTFYIDMVLSLLAGDPHAWDVRMYFMPAILTAPVALLDLFGVEGTQSRILVIQTTIAAFCWAGIGLTYLIARREFGRARAVLATAILAGTYYWLENGTQVLLDVPMGVLFLASLYYALRGPLDTANVVAAVLLGAAAVCTKIQIAPAILVIGLYLVLSPPDRAGKLHNLKFAAIAAAAAFVVYAAIEFAVGRAPFDHLAAFMTTNLVDQTIVCNPGTTYLAAIPNVLSYILPVFVLGGLMLSARRGVKTAVVVLACAAYIASLHFVCHKEQRYLTPVIPVFAIFGAVALDRLYRFVRDLAQRIAVVPERLQTPALAVGFAAFFALMLFTMVPRQQLMEAATRAEACPNFVYATIDALAADGLPRPKAIMVVHPCEVPKFPLRPIVVDKNTYGLEESRRLVNLEEIRTKANQYDLIFVEVGSKRERDLTEAWPDTFQVYRTSPKGLYRVYARRGWDQAASP